jgi:hypothetical protein
MLIRWTLWRGRHSIMWHRFNLFDQGNLHNNSIQALSNQSNQRIPSLERVILLVWIGHSTVKLVCRKNMNPNCPSIFPQTRVKIHKGWQHSRMRIKVEKKNHCARVSRVSLKSRVVWIVSKGNRFLQARITLNRQWRSLHWKCPQLSRVKIEY